MAKVWYKLKAGATELHATDDDQVLIVSELQDQLTALEEIQGLGDELRTLLAQGGIPSLGLPGGYPDLATFDDDIEREVWRLSDILDYPAYDSRVENTTVRDGNWFTPEALESVSDELVGNEGTLSIDGDNGTYWQSEINGTRSIVFRLRGYPKRVERLRFRTNSGDTRAELQNMTVRMSRALTQIDDPSNEIATGVNITRAGSAQTEWALPSPQINVRYIKLECAASLHTSPDHLRIREIDVRVITANHDK